MKGAYYNENNPEAAAWLRELIARRLIAVGDVDERSISDVRADELGRYAQCHFFAGIGGWSYALRLAGWPDDRPVWTGSCPCQPFSLAGKQKGFADDRHLWPVWRGLIEKRRPAIVFGEQVASATEWLGLVRSDLEAMGYAVGAAPVQAASAGADHLRDRFWFVANATGEQVGTAGQSRQRGDVGDSESQRGNGRENPSGPSGRHVAQSDCGGMANSEREQRIGQWLSEPEERDHPDAIRSDRGSELSWVTGADGKARRVKPGVRLLVDGFPCRVGLLRGFGNAIDPRPASEFIAAADEAIRTAAAID